MQQKLCPTQLNSTQLNSTQLNSELLEKIIANENSYNDFKQQIINYCSFQQNNFDENLMGFALLTALNFADSEFIKLLTNKFDFDDTKYSFKRKKLHCPWIAFAKAYYCIKQNKRQEAKYIFWRIFAEVSPDYFSKKDFLLLINLLTESNETNDIQNCNLLVKYCELKYNNDIDFKIEQAKYQIANENYNTFYKDKHKANIDFLLKYLNNVFDYYLLAQLCYSVKQMDSFYKCYEKAFLKLQYSPTGHDFANQIITGWEGESTYEANYMLSLLNKVVDSLENIGEKPFLNGGTLLGMYRDGKLINYDCDADIAILKNDRNNLDEYIQKILQTILKDNPNLDYYMGHYPGEINHYSAITFVDKSSKLHIDLAFMYNDNYFEDNPNKKYYSGFFTSMSPMFFSFDKFSLVRKKFCGKDYWIPDNSEHYLEQLYSKDWKKPLKRWNTFISAPNLSTKCKLSAFYFTLPAFLSALSKNNYEESLYYYEEFQRWDYPFTDEMKNHIENYLQQIKANQK